MNNTITISSNNFNGELVNILFKPDNQDITINLGDVNIPYSFNTEGIIPPCEVYGTYTILVKSTDCPYFMNVVRTTPSPTPTPSPTSTPTITPTHTFYPTSTPSITASYPIYPTSTPEPTSTPTPTQTPTPSPTPPACIDTWTIENFDGTTFRNGDTIPQATNQTEWSDATTNETPAWCYYNFDSNNGPVYGKLYNWFVVSDPRGIGPNGYIVPSESDWDTFEICLGGNSIAGGKLKTTGTIENNDGLWYSPNLGATNEVGFSVIPSGYMSDGGFSDLLNSRGSFWTTTEIGGGSVMVMNLNDWRTDVYHGPDSKGKGYSIRLKQGAQITPTPTPTSSPLP